MELKSAFCVMILLAVARTACSAQQTTLNEDSSAFKTQTANVLVPALVQSASGKLVYTLEADDFDSRFAELCGEDSTDRAHADNYDICFFSCHFSPCCALSRLRFADCYTPVIGARLKASLLSISVRVKIGCAPGNPTSCHPE